MSEDEIFAQRMRLAKLLDIYKGLLTEKQKLCLQLYFDDDLSISEISEELKVSRQAVHDLLKRVESILERYESTLEILSREEKLQKQLEIAIRLLQQESLPKSDEALGILQRLRSEGR